MAGRPETMRAAVYRGPRELAVEQRPVPELGERDVLLEVSHCGVCGTDLHLVLEGMGMPNSIGGHEYSGTIVARGPEVNGWELGTAVVGGGPRGCGRCSYCRRGRPSLCAGRQAWSGDFQGAFAEYVRVRDDQLVRIPEGVSQRAAALTEPLAVALHALTVSRVRAGARTLVSGTGPLGLLVIAALRARGIDDVSASEPSSLRREAAGAVGATALLEPGDLEHPRIPFEIIAKPYDVVFECSGNPRAMESGLAQLRGAGTLVLVGTGMRRPKLDHNRILMNELVVTGSYNYDADGFRDALELLASGALLTDRLIESEDVPLESMFDALERLERRELAGKVMITPKEQT